MSHFELKYKPFGEHSILVEWPSIIDENVLKDIVCFKNSLQKVRIKEIVDINYGYNSLLISYHSAINNFYDAFLELKVTYSAKDNEKHQKRNLWKIPVCYDEKYGIDLVGLSQRNKLSKDDIIKLHSTAIYTIFFIGFLPGFLYLGGLNKKLFSPRKTTPSLQVKKGSVAIGGQQTGIYPHDSPGGWHVIGNSPINLFDTLKEKPCFASPGDKIQFITINDKEYNDIKVLVEAGVYQIESEVLNG